MFERVKSRVSLQTFHKHCDRRACFENVAGDIHLQQMKCPMQSISVNRAPEVFALFA